MLESHLHLPFYVSLPQGWEGSGSRDWSTGRGKKQIVGVRVLGGLGCPPTSTCLDNGNIAINAKE
jgi:hypothetical protein